MDEDQREAFKAKENIIIGAMIEEYLTGYDFDQGILYKDGTEMTREDWPGEWSIKKYRDDDPKYNIVAQVMLLPIAKFFFVHGKVDESERRPDRK